MRGYQTRFAAEVDRGAHDPKHQRDLETIP
jgi:hypothetical protein